MLDRNARYCPTCKEPLEIRVRFVSASPRKDRKDRYLWCQTCKAGMRVQRIVLDGPRVRINP